MTWGNALSELIGREEKLKEGIALAEKYQVISSSLYGGVSPIDSTVTAVTVHLGPVY